MASYPFLLPLVSGALATIGLWFICWNVGSFLGVLQLEATAKGKRIEFAGALIAILALVATIAGLVYSAVKIDALEDRVLKLEMTLEALSSKPKL